MTAPPKFPPVTAERMEPGGSEWQVCIDNARTPVHTWRTYAEKLTESEARFIAAGINGLSLLRRFVDDARQTAQNSYAMPGLPLTDVAWESEDPDMFALVKEADAVLADAEDVG